MHASWNLVAVMLVMSGASGCCVQHSCPNIVTVALNFVDASGNPLSPMDVTEGTFTTSCETEDGGMSGACSGNVTTVTMRGGDMITARATTGEVFTGSITPEGIGQLPATDQCDCPVNLFAPITITLTMP